MSSTEYEGPDIELGARLRSLRQARSFSLEHVARKAGMSASKLSRIETGSSRASRHDIEFLLDFLGATNVARGEIINVAREVSWTGEPGVQLHFGRPNSDNQAVLREAECTFQTMRSLDCVLVPGMLQSAAYAAGVFRSVGVQDDEAVAEAVRRRMKRQSMLFDRNKTFEFLVIEGALRNRYVSVDEMRTQYQHIASLVSLPNVQFGVVPSSKRLPVLPYSMVLYDDTITFNEFRVAFTVSSRYKIDVRRDIEVFGRIADIALWDEDAAAFVYEMLKDTRDDTVDLAADAEPVKIVPSPTDIDITSREEQLSVDS